MVINNSCNAGKRELSIGQALMCSDSTSEELLSGVKAPSLSLLVRYGTTLHQYTITSDPMSDLIQLSVECRCYRDCDSVSVF